MKNKAVIAWNTDDYTHSGADPQGIFLAILGHDELIRSVVLY